MGLTDLANRIWYTGRYLLGGTALAAALLAGGDVWAQENESGDDSEEIESTAKPSKDPEIVIKKKQTIESEKESWIRRIHYIAKEKAEEHFKGWDDDEGLTPKNRFEYESYNTSDVKRAINSDLGTGWKEYGIDIESIIREEYDSAKPGLISQLLNRPAKFFSEKREFSGNVSGYTTDYHRKTPADSDFEDDIIEDYEFGLYYRHLGDENLAFFIRGAYLSEENKNNRSDGHLYADGLFTLAGDADRTYFRFSPQISFGPHFKSGSSKIEVGTRTSSNSRMIGYLFGGFTRSDDFFFYSDPWDYEPSTILDVEIDSHRKIKQGELALEFQGGERETELSPRSEDMLYRICALLYSREEDRLYDYRKDYAGTTNFERYRYDWDFHERETAAKIAFVVEPGSQHNPYLNISAWYTKVDRTEIFDNPFTTPDPTHIEEKTTTENGSARAVLAFPWVFVENIKATVPKTEITVGGEKYRHYGYIGLLFESWGSKRYARMVQKSEEPMRPEYYAKRHSFFRETLTGEGNLVKLTAGYHSEDRKGGEEDRLYLYGSLLWTVAVNRNFVMSGNIEHFQDVNTEDRPFDLHAELQLQFRTTHSNNIWGIGGGFDMESEEFEDPKQREMRISAYLFWSF